VKRNIYTLHIHTAGGRQGYILYVHTAGSGNGYTLHVRTAGCGKWYTLHVHKWLLMVLFLIYEVEKPKVKMPECWRKVSTASPAFLPVFNCLSLVFRH
jgi:hypothetical protein